jgi:hypothetical protein
MRLSGIIGSSSELADLRTAAIGFTIHTTDDHEVMRLWLPLCDARVEEGQELDHTIH